MNTKSEFKNQSWIQFKSFIAVPSGMLMLFLVAATSPAQIYSVLHSFNGSDGGYYCAGLELSGSTLYGTKYQGGSNDCGVVFKVNIDGSGFAVLRRFIGGYDGYAPEGVLVAFGGTLYGTTECGGMIYHPPYPFSAYGTVFRINADGSGYKVLKAFHGSASPEFPYDGGYPRAGLVLFGSTLYGTTQVGANFYTYPGDGTVFEINTNGGAYAVLRSFTGSDGSGPLGSLVLSGTNLYGTTYSGGISNCGTVFKINADGTGFTVLKSFTGNDGSGPYKGLAMSGNVLYGTTASGGSSGLGTLFRVNTDGSGYTALKSFTGGNDGGGPSVGLLLSGTTLFGTMPWGGISNYGTLYKVNTDGSGYTVLKQFAGGSDGAKPCGNLILSGSTLYGATANGGSPNYGVVFSLSLPPVIITPPQSQTSEMGSGVEFAMEADSSSTPAYQWFFNGTNAIACTNSCLALINVRYSQSGAYTVVITNVAGAVTSAPVMLNVIAQVPRRPVPAIILTGDVGSDLHLEYTDALGLAANWLPLDTVTLTNTSQFSCDPNEPLPPQRFYRAWQLGTPVVVPSLRLPSFVPAITLTGSIGDSVRLDYINAVGPIDAWVTLDTITLTNTTQLYFDTSGPWSSGRLYRIVPVP